MLLTWEFKSVEEAQEFLAGLIAKPQLAGQLGVAKPTEAAAIEPAKDSVLGPNTIVTSDNIADVQHKLAEANTAVAAILEKKKRGPKPKASHAAAPMQVSGSRDIADAARPAVIYGIEDCRAALSALFDTKGRDAAKAALAEFKVERIGGLKPDQYRGFIVMCETLSQPE